jgi:hypothetical protein
MRRVLRHPLNRGGDLSRGLLELSSRIQRPAKHGRKRRTRRPLQSPPRARGRLSSVRLGWQLGPGSSTVAARVRARLRSSPPVRPGPQLSEAAETRTRRLADLGQTSRELANHDLIRDRPALDSQLRPAVSDGRGLAVGPVADGNGSLGDGVSQLVHGGSGAQSISTVASDARAPAARTAAESVATS